MTPGSSPALVLDLEKRSPEVHALVKNLNSRIVGQPEAVKVLADIVETYQSGLCDPFRPAGSALFMGCTGSGKTATVEAACEVLFGNPRACVKIDAAEYQHSHELSKLIGSPAGYLGHRETPALLNQKRLQEFHTERLKLGVVLIDEIEKASDALFQLFLGILDKATLTLGDTSVVNFSQTIVVMTSNLGAKDISRLMLGKGLGYRAESTVPVDKAKIDDIAVEAARKHFSPEFINRVDYTVVFNSLTEADVRQIMHLELGIVQRSMWKVGKFLYQLTNKAKDKIMEEGFSKEYGAREIRRAIEKRVRLPLARLLASAQINTGDIIIVDDKGGKDFEFSLTHLKDTQVTFTDFTKEIL
jgi:ATP-dependent Clp protease ATP-binding subunit ClpA